MPMPTRGDIRDDLYKAMRAAITDNTGYLFRGRDKQPGAQVGKGTFTHLARWGWVDVVKVEIVKRGQIHHEIAGGWLTRAGRAALRAEILRRGDTMPDRLATPRTPAPSRSVADRQATTARRTPRAPRIGAPAGVTVTARTGSTRSATADVDPFALIATGGGRTDDDIPF